jgi:hypothetical protein
MNANRDAWFEDMKDGIPMLSLGNFATFLPNISDDDIKRIRERLTRTDHLKDQTFDATGEQDIDSLWSQFPTRPSKTFNSIRSFIPVDAQDLSFRNATTSNGQAETDSSGKSQREAEPVIFKMLERVCEAVKDACLAELGRSSNTVFITDPGRTFYSTVDLESSHKVDGQDSLNKSVAVEILNIGTSQYHECDVVWLAEFKKTITDSNVGDVRFQVSSSNAN